jgi:hypothetical protein
MERLHLRMDYGALAVTTELTASALRAITRNPEEQSTEQFGLD